MRVKRGLYDVQLLRRERIKLTHEIRGFTIMVSFDLRLLEPQLYFDPHFLNRHSGFQNTVSRHDKSLEKLRRHFNNHN
jgi:hypothetical protein